MTESRTSKLAVTQRSWTLAPSRLGSALRFGLGPSLLAFTLIEMLLALAVSSIVLVAIGGVFFSALQLRERAAAAVDQAVPLQHALNCLRRDLQGAMPPGSVLGGNFIYGTLNNGVGQGFGLQFATTTGVLRDDLPWGDVQEVTYELRLPVGGPNRLGKDLVRTVSRNLLTTTMLDAQEEYLLGNVQSLEVFCFDGANWLDSWDTTLSQTNLPTAVRLRLQFASEQPVDPREQQPIELVIPLGIQLRISQTQTNEVTQ